jgi:hypothetical protein
MPIPHLILQKYKVWPCCATIIGLLTVSWPRFLNHFLGWISIHYSIKYSTAIHVSGHVPARVLIRLNQFIGLIVSITTTYFCCIVYSWPKCHGILIPASASTHTHEQSEWLNLLCSSRLDHILGKSGSKKSDANDLKMSLASRIVKVERQVSIFINVLRGAQISCQAQLSPAHTA